MGLYDPVVVQSRDALERVDVLRKDAREELLAREEDKKVVRQGGQVVAWENLAREREEGLWVSEEVGQLENGFRVWKLVLLQVGVEPCFRRAEVWDAGGCGREESITVDQLVGRECGCCTPL